MDQFNCNNNNNNNINNNKTGSFGITTNRQQSPTGGVEDITNKLDQMNVDIVDMDMNVIEDHRFQTNQLHLDQAFTISHQQNVNPNAYLYYDQTEVEPNIMMQRNQDFDINRQLDGRQQQQQQSNILIATNVDSSVFSDNFMQAKFESLFLAYDSNITFRYLKSFRRVRLDFTSGHRAELARSNLSDYRLGNTQFKCYSAQIIRANNTDVNAQGLAQNSTHLNIPKLTKQFLISPPASPPVGWEPVHEGSPCIDVQLISAIANLVPGKVHEIHAGNESQPGIYVEVCEDVQSEASKGRNCSRIPRTMAPDFSQPINCNSPIDHCSE